MQFHEFVGKVRERAKIDSQDDAVKSIKIILQTLGERLQGGEADHLAAQLPEELKPFIAGKTESTRFSSDEFIERISKRQGLDRRRAEQTTRSVLAVLREAVTEGEFQDVLSQLPEDYQRLFTSGG